MKTARSRMTPSTRWTKRALLFAALLAPLLSIAQHKAPVKVAVPNGMTLDGLWSELSEKFTKDTGWPLELVVAGSRSVIAEAMQAGTVDLITLHAREETAELLAQGVATGMKPWACNEHCIMGPSDDPAGIRGLKDGAAALKKIAQSKSPFVNALKSGSGEVAQRLWQAAGTEPEGAWLLKDESTEEQGIVAFAATKHAYVIAGRVPALEGKSAASSMVVVVQGDPAMRRPYVVLIADARTYPKSNQAGAKALSEWMTGEPGQAFLRDYARRHPEMTKLFFPVADEAGEKP